MITQEARAAVLQGITDFGSSVPGASAVAALASSKASSNTDRQCLPDGGNINFARASQAFADIISRKLSHGYETALSTPKAASSCLSWGGYCVMYDIQPIQPGPDTIAFPI